MMNFFEFKRKSYEKESVTLDAADSTESQPKNGDRAFNKNDGDQNQPNQIAEYSHNGRILSAEELLEHRKHCRARPGNCPFEKAVDEADDITPKDLKVASQVVYTRLAAIMTQLFQTAKNLAKPALVEDVKKGGSVPIKDGDANRGNTDKTTQDAAPEDEPNEDARIVAEIIEAGIEKMCELAKAKGVDIKMDEKGTRYIVKAPPRDTPAGE